MNAHSMRAHRASLKIRERTVLGDCRDPEKRAESRDSLGTTDDKSDIEMEGTRVIKLTITAEFSRVLPNLAPDLRRKKEREGRDAPA